MNTKANKQLPIGFFVCGILSILLLSQASVGKNPKKTKHSKHSAESIAVIPSSRSDNGWMERHDELVKRVQKSDIEIAFFGDSITERMNETLMHQIIGPKSDHFGIGGDRSQNFLWRLQNGELNFASVAPKIIVVLMGTNNISKWENTPSNTNEEIEQGVKADLQEIRKQLPKTKILLLGILPRDAKSSSPIRKRVTEINILLKQLADNKHIWFTDIGPKLLETDGTLSDEVMPDHLHPSNEKGYDLMFKAIKPELEALK